MTVVAAVVVPADDAETLVVVVLVVVVGAAVDAVGEAVVEDTDVKSFNKSWNKE